MTTQSWSTRVRHDSDATWQEWRDELITKLGLLVAAGVLAADETNITPAAGARAGVNTEAGYAVYHLSDSLHATAPVYFRFGLGTGQTTTTPRIQITVGTSTNGSGVLGGTALSAITSIHGNAAQITDTARQSYMCCVAGFFGLDWKTGSGANAGMFFFCRTCDNDGAITATGGLARWGIGNSTQLSNCQAYRYAATAAAYTASGNNTVLAALAICPQSPAGSQVGSDIQVFLGWTITPRVAPLFGVCGVFSSELVPGGTFSATLVGTTARTFLTTATTGGPFSPNTAAPGYLTTAILWE